MIRGGAAASPSASPPHSTRSPKGEAKETSAAPQRGKKPFEGGRGPVRDRFLSHGSVDATLASVCDRCQAGGAIEWCKGCTKVVYCTKICQMKAWKEGHRDVCRRLAHGQEPEAPKPPRRCGVCGELMKKEEGDLVKDEGALPCGHDVCRECIGSLNRLGIKYPCVTCKPPKGQSMVDTAHMKAAVLMAKAQRSRGTDAEDHAYASAVQALTRVLEMEPTHREAHHAMAVCYNCGLGVPRDAAKAVEHFQIATEQQHAAAQCGLGVCYATGHGVPEDMDRAIALYTLSADQGYPQAQCILAECYRNAVGLEQDLDKMIQLLEAATAQGHPPAQYKLARCYQFGVVGLAGEGVAPDADRAAALFKAAAAQGHAHATQELEKNAQEAKAAGIFK